MIIPGIPYSRSSESLSSAVIIPSKRPSRVGIIELGEDGIVTGTSTGKLALMSSDSRTKIASMAS